VALNPGGETIADAFASLPEGDTPVGILLSTNLDREGAPPGCRVELRPNEGLIVELR